MTFGITEPWPGYPPEMNAFRMESGVGAPTWIASAEMWALFAGLTGEAIAVMMAEIASLTANWNGPAAIQLTMATGPHFAWLGLMEAIAAFNAMSCFAVVEAYALATGTMIPVPVITANRVAELTAEATNFFGINEGLILFLNQQYGQYWVENATNMVTYDEAVSIATIPKPSFPPPPLSDAGQAVGQLAETMALSPSSMTDPIMSGLQESLQGPSNAAGAPMDMMEKFVSAGPQLLQGPGQALQQAGSSLTSPIQSLTSPLQSLFSEFGGNAENAEAVTGAGPWTPAFASASSSDMSGQNVTGAGPAPIIGGNLAGGSMLGNYPNSGAGTNPVVKSQQIFTGVPTASSRSDMSLTSNTTGAAPVGGGMPMAPHGAGALANANSGAQRRDADLVMSLNPVGGTSDRRT